MKVILIKDKDVQILRDRLKLEKFELQGKQLPVFEIYRHFNFVVESWLRDISND